MDNALDRLLLLFAFNYPFVAFIARDPEAMKRVPAALRSGVNGLAMVLLAGTIVLAVAWLGRQVQRAVTGEALNVPEVSATRGGDSDALDRVADADAAQANRDRGHSDYLSQPAISSADLVS